VEEQVLGPHYKALGANTEFGNKYTHDELLQRMDALAVLTKDLAIAVEKEVIEETAISPTAADCLVKLTVIKNHFATAMDLLHPQI